VTVPSGAFAQSSAVTSEPIDDLRRSRMHQRCFNLEHHARRQDRQIRTQRAVFRSRVAVARRVLKVSARDRNDAGAQSEAETYDEERE
jgi:hypothetical protein